MAVQTTPAALTAKCLPINLGIPLHLGQRVVWIQAPHATRLGTSSWIQNQPAWKQNGKGKKNVFWILHQKVLLRLLSKNFTGMEHAIGTSAIHPAARTVPQHRQRLCVSLPAPALEGLPPAMDKVLNSPDPPWSCECFPLSSLPSCYISFLGCLQHFPYPFKPHIKWVHSPINRALLEYF